MTSIARRALLQMGGVSLAAIAVPAYAQSKPSSAADLAQLDGIATAQAIRERSVSQSEVIEAAIARAEAAEPRINAIVTSLYDRARQQVAAPQAASPGPLNGVPTFIKDLLDVTGAPTKRGARLFEANIAHSQPPYTDALLAAGLNPLGKSTTPAFGASPTTEPLAHGATRNPWNLGHSVGGSSGGAAALVAAGVVPLANGSDAGGSIRIPSSCCGVFGLKPTQGRLVEDGVAQGPVPFIMQHVLTRSVRDSALMLALTERSRPVSDGFEPVGLVSGPSSRRLRIGVHMTSLNGDAPNPDVQRTIEQTAALCASLGHSVREVGPPINGPAFADAYALFHAAAGASIVSQARATLGRMPTADEVEPLTLGLAAHFSANKWKILGALMVLKSTRRAYASAFKDVDLLLTPVTLTPPPPIGYLAPDVPFETLFRRMIAYTGYTPLQNIAGNPAMSVPMGQSGEGLPIGAHFAARRGDDRTLLELAYELEKAQPWSIVPALKAL